jgi:hypothetical protein
MRPSKFENTHAKIVELVADGETMVGACERIGLPCKTVEKWLTEGRAEPAGKYAKFAQALDAARRPSRDDDDLAEWRGPVEREVAALIVSRELDDEARVIAAQARVLARTVDTLSMSSGSSAGLALAAVSRRLDDCVSRLRAAPKDEVTRIVEARRARLAAHGIPVASSNGAVGDAA